MGNINSGQSSNGLIQRFIGSDLDTIRAAADGLDNIAIIVANLEDLLLAATVATQATEILQTVAATTEANTESAEIAQEVEDALAVANATIDTANATVDAANEATAAAADSAASAQSMWESVAAGGGDMWAYTYDPTNVGGDAFLRSNHVGTQSIATIDSLQTALDSKLDSVNLSASKTATTVTVTNSEGNNAIIPAATESLAGIMTADDKVLLDGLVSDSGETASAFTYTDGVLMSMNETFPLGIKATTFTYTDGALTTSVEVYNGVTKTTTYTYVDGVLTSYGVIES